MNDKVKGHGVIEDDVSASFLDARNLPIPGGHMRAGDGLHNVVVKGQAFTSANRILLGRDVSVVALDVLWSEM